MGVWRAQFGNLDDGRFGFKVSKPGIDVTTADYGDLLFDSSSIAFQKVATGFTAVSSGIAWNSSTPYSTQVSFPMPNADYATASNLQMWGVGYYQSVGDLTTDQFGTTFRMNINNGIITLGVTTTWDTRFTPVYLSWVIFNCQVQ
jgi:hypothetical protein